MTQYLGNELKYFNVVMKYNGIKVVSVLRDTTRLITFSIGNKVPDKPEAVVISHFQLILKLNAITTPEKG